MCWISVFIAKIEQLPLNQKNISKENWTENISFRNPKKKKSLRRNLKSEGITFGLINKRENFCLALGTTRNKTQDFFFLKKAYTLEAPSLSDDIALVL